MTAAKAAPEFSPKTAIATAIAQLEVVTGSSKCQRRGLAVIRADHFAHPERHQKHDDKIHQQRNGDAHHVQRYLHDQIALEAKHQHDGEQQRDQRQRTDFWHHDGVIALAPD